MIDRSGAAYVGNLGPVPLFIHPSAIILVFLAWMWAPTGSGGADIVAIILLLAVLVKAILLHELGHGFAAMILGARDVTITLWAMGGLCSSQRNHDRPVGEMFILAAGPAVSFALYGIGLGSLYALAHYRPDLLIDGGQATLLREFIVYTIVINFWLGVFNSLPIFPLDGGQFLYHLLRLFKVPWQLVHQLCFYLAVVFVVLLLLWRFHAGQGQIDGGMVYTVILLGFLLYNAHIYLMQR
ncbi:MAG: hypothetical protein EA401_08915 [Planctomycetota bacterium]|nr:MAG: hypothetical protein EA401_08915 [Planctomycetota bacterium]